MIHTIMEDLHLRDKFVLKMEVDTIIKEMMIDGEDD